MDHADDLDLLYYWRVLLRARVMIALVAFVAAAATLLYTRFAMQPVYKTSAVILLRESSPAVLTIPSVAAQLVPGLAARSVGTSGQHLMALAILKSRRLATTVKQELKLPETFRIEGEGGAISESSATVKAESAKEGQIVITVAAHTGSLCADIANAYVKALEEYQQSDEASSSQRHMHYIETQLHRTQGEMDKAEDALKRFQERHEVVAMEADTAALQERLWKVDAEAATARIALDEARQRLSALRPRLVRRAESEGAPALANAAEVERLRGKLADAESALLVEKRAYTDEHPRIRELTATAESIRGALRAYMARSVEAAYEGTVPELIDLEVEVVAGATRETALRTERDRLQQQLRRLPETALQYARLTRDAKVKGSVFEMLSQEYYRAKMAVAQASYPVVALDSALAPKAPSSPKLKRNTLLGGLLGLLLGVMMALVLDWMRAAREPNRSLPGRERDRADSDLDVSRR